MQSVGDYQYRPGELIGHGAFALVFKGHHKQTQVPVAIKQILLKNIPGKLSVARQEEISILKDLKHTNIVQLYYYHETSSEIFLVMEFCNGGDLAEYLQIKKTLCEDSIRHLIINIAQALQVIHQRHIIHRDIKPQNLLLSYPVHNKQASLLPFSQVTVKLADFGFARYLTGADMAATLCGSPLYMAPEILLGRRYDDKADLWSTGTILYQCLTGRAPFEATNPHALRRRYAKETLVPRIPPGTSPYLTDLLLKLLKKNVQERINHSSLTDHPFLSSTHNTQVSLSHDISSHHTKSSPVPIQRKQSSNYNTPSSPYSSPHSQSSFSGRKLSITSPSSGPPTLHKIGSSSSLAAHNYSPPSTKDIEDFVLVGKTQDCSRISPSSKGSPSSYNSLSRQQSVGLVGPLTGTRLTPPSSISPSLTRRDSQPFSSLFKMGHAPNDYRGSPQQVTTPSLPSSGSNSSFKESPVKPVINTSLSSQKSSRQNSLTKMAVLVEGNINLSPKKLEQSSQKLIFESTHFFSESLLMRSDILQDGLDKLMEDKTQCSPENLFGQLQVQDELLKEAEQSGRGLFTMSEPSSPEPHPSNEEGMSEEMFSLQLEEDSNDKGLSALKFSVIIAQELLKLAKSRQGPMLLLSSSMGDSGRVLDHAQRFSEQLILCVKAAQIIESGCNQYQINLAVSSLEPNDKHKTMYEEARQLQEHCLEKGQLARELYSKCVGKQYQPVSRTIVTAEKLIFLQAVDMCKQTILEENSLQRDEIIRRYRVSLLLFQLLSSDAKTERDRMALKKYESSIQKRYHTLTKSSSPLF